jgi:hypothetical protein
MLLEAYDYACGLNHDLWDFSIELKSLKKAGLTVNDLRWLLCNHYADHAFETTMLGDQKRSFRTQKHMSLHKRSCFVLTEKGADFLRESLSEEQGGAKDKRISFEPGRNGNGVKTSGNTDEKSDESLIPIWDCDQHELRYGTQIVKQFRLPCPNQTIILSAFQEEEWPRRIDDPLPPRDEIDTKRRLHDTIKSLNRKQKSKRIRFRGDGTGTGVLWELISNTAMISST